MPDIHNFIPGAGHTDFRHNAQSAEIHAAFHDFRVSASHAFVRVYFSR
jgi:hypothetical protein